MPSCLPLSLITTPRNLFTPGFLLIELSTFQGGGDGGGSAEMSDPPESVIIPLLAHAGPPQSPPLHPISPLLRILTLAHYRG